MLLGLIYFLFRALDRFCDLLDASQPSVPFGPDSGQLGCRAGELFVIDAIELLAS